MPRVVHTLMSEDELKQWVLRRLGAPILKVELDSEHLTDSVEQAIRWFNAKKGIQKRRAISVVSGQVAYDLDDDVETVTDVAFSSSKLDLSLIFAPSILADEEIPYDVYASAGALGLYSSFEQSLMYINTAKRLIGADLDWSQDDRKLYIYPGNKDSGTAVIFFKTNQFTIEQLGERDHDMLKRYALATAKQDLGRIRSKYDNYPTAQGSVNLDGSTLLEEARVEIEALEEEIALSGFPMGFMMG